MRPDEQLDAVAVPGAVVQGILGEDNVIANIDEEELPVGRRWHRPKGLRLLAAIWLILILGACFLAPWLPLPDPEAGVGEIAEKPFSPGHILGTDQLGRDMMSRILWGGRTSCFLAIMTTLLAATLGLTLGILAGYFKGKLEWLIAGAADVLLAFPALIMLPHAGVGGGTPRPRKLSEPSATKMMAA